MCKKKINISSIVVLRLNFLIAHKNVRPGFRFQTKFIQNVVNQSSCQRKLIREVSNEADTVMSGRALLFIDGYWSVFGEL